MLSENDYYINDKGEIMMVTNNSNELDSDLPNEIGKPAKRALLSGGYFKLEQLSKLNEAEILKLHGIGPKALEQLRHALLAKGLSFAKK